MKTLIYYTVYRTTNKITGKIYIGAHQTDNPNDDYLGSGELLLKAIKKHGRENFEKEILSLHESSELMYEDEAKIVDESFVKRGDTYNMKVGGYGGWSHLTQEDVWRNYSEEERKRRLSENGKKGNKALLEKRINDPEFDRKIREDNAKKFLGKHHKEESKKKIGEANSILQNGEGNSQFGTKWIYNIELEQNKKILKDESIPNGWESGRIINFKKYKERLKQKQRSREEKRKKREIELEEISKKHNLWYSFYRDKGFKEFCSITGYDKSQANLVMQFAKYVKEFIPIRGKKRGK